MWDILNLFTHDGSGGLSQAITADAATTNVMDLGAANLNIAGGKKGIYLVAIVTETFTNLTSLEILLQTDTDSTFATALKEVEKREFALATLVAGTILINQRLNVALYQRWMRGYFNVVGSTPDAGEIIMGFTDGPESAGPQLDQVTL